MIRKCWFIAALIFAGACVCRAALVFTGSYSQNFDGLPSSESTGNAWVDDSTIAGWYANQSTYAVNHGNSPSVGIYDFGSSGSSDRSLGSITGSGATTIYYGVALQNNTAGTITTFQISYHGEQWRLGNGNVTDTLTVQYLTGDPSGNNIANDTWITVSSLNFTSPQIGSNGTSLDGNAAANSATISFTLNGLDIANGSDIWFRWMDNDVANNDAGLAIDNFSIQTVPESRRLGWMVGAGLLALCGWRIWRQCHSGEKLKS
jgi:hypothetical protein